MQPELCAKSIYVVGVFALPRGYLLTRAVLAAGEMILAAPARSGCAFTVWFQNVAPWKQTSYDG